MGCCKSGGTPSGGSGTNSLAEDPNTPTDPGGTPLGQDGSKGGTVPYYGSAGGAGPSTMQNGGLYVGVATEHALGKNKTFSKVDPSTINPERGGVAEHFESGRNPAAIGYDTTGGTSYGKYQIATKTGTMNEFLKYEKVNNPDAYNNLMAAGGDSYAGQNSQAFKDAWVAQVKNDPSFSNDQDGFMQVSSYDPVRNTILKNTGIDVNQRSLAVQQTVWASACMNGPNSSVFTKAFAGKDTSNMSDQDIINALDDERSKTDANGNLAYYVSSPKNIQNAVANRLVKERQLELSLVPT